MAQNSPAASSPSQKRQAAIVLAALYAGYLLSFGDRVIFGMALKPIKHTLQLSDSELGLLSGVAFAVSYAVFSPVGGYIVDRARRTVILAGAVTFWSVATFATAFATTFLGMGFARCGVGAGEALLHPLAVSLLGDTVPPKARPRAFSLYMSAGAIGAVVAQILGGLLILRLTAAGRIDVPILGALEPWQGLFVGAAIPGVLLAALIIVFMKEPRRSPAPPLSVKTSHSGWSFLKAHPKAAFALFVGISTVQMGAYTFTTWSVLVFQRVYGLTAGHAAFWIACTGGVATLVGCLLAGNLITALRNRGHIDAPFQVGAIAAIGFATMASVALMAPTATVALCILPFATFWSYMPSVAAYSAMGDVLPSPIRARLAGLHTLTNGIISNSLGPYLAGAFSDHFFPQNDGIRWALIATICLASTLGVIILAIGRCDYRTLAAAARVEAATASDEVLS